MSIIAIWFAFQILDSKSVQLKNTRGNTQRRAGKALYNLHESLPGDWQTFTDNNIRLAEQVKVFVPVIWIIWDVTVCQG